MADLVRQSLEAKQDSASHLSRKAASSPHTGLVLGQEGVLEQAAVLGRGCLGCRRSP